MDESNVGISRRRILELAGISLIGFVAQACAGVLPSPPSSPSTAATSEPPSKALPTIEGVNTGRGAPPQTPVQPGQVMITPTKDFYTVAYQTEKPSVPGDWKLTIGGNVDKSLTLSLDDLKQLPVVEEMRTLECISNPAGGPLISNAVWKGFKFKDLLDRAGVKANTQEFKLESFDGYSTAIPLDLALHDHALLVYEMNGEPLPVEHGKPLRCLWPGRYGMKQPKWLTKVTAITTGYKGFWEGQGWSDQAYILPTSRIDAPAEGDLIKSATLDLNGIGFSGEAGIAKIEVSLDGGKTWQDASVIRGPSPYVWTNWSWSGPTPSDGSYTLLARVTDRQGATQTVESSAIFGGTFPNGTAEMHPVPITVKRG